MKQVRVSVGGDKNEPVNEPVKLTKATQQVLECLKRTPDTTIDIIISPTKTFEQERQGAKKGRWIIKIDAR